MPGSGTTGVMVAGLDAAFLYGRPVIVRETAPAGYEKLIAGPVVQIGEGSVQPAKPVTLSFPPVAGSLCSRALPVWRQHRPGEDR